MTNKGLKSAWRHGSQSVKLMAPMAWPCRLMAVCIGVAHCSSCCSTLPTLNKHCKQGILGG